MSQAPEGAKAKPSSPTEAAADPAPNGDGGLSVAGIVLAAIGGGIGVLGFVAFFGGAILWVRMDEAGLPGNEAVAVIPRSVLLSTGANFLVPSLLAALAFVAVLYLIETITVMWSTRTLRGLEAKLEQREEIAEARQEEATEAILKATEAAKVVTVMQEAAEKASASPAVDEQVAREAERVAQTAVQNATEMQRETVPAAHQAKRELQEIRQEVEDERLAARDGVEAMRRNLRWLLTGAAFVLGAVATFVWFSIGIDPGRFVILLVLIVALSTVSLAILGRTDSFPWFALAVVVAVGILSGFLTYYRTVDHTKVEPAAVLRSKGAPVYGFFVAQTSDRVYLGTKIAGGAVRLAAIPRDEVTELAIGSLEPVAEAEEQARTLAVQICRLARQRPARDGSAAGGERAEPCTDADLLRLTS